MYPAASSAGESLQLPLVRVGTAVDSANKDAVNGDNLPAAPSSASRSSTSVGYVIESSFCFSKRDREMFLAESNPPTVVGHWSAQQCSRYRRATRTRSVPALPSS